MVEYPLSIMIMNGVPYLEHPSYTAGERFYITSNRFGKVVAVDGDSGASVGDRAGYKEYQLPCEGGASVFFEENWFKGEKNVCRRITSTVGEY